MIDVELQKYFNDKYPDGNHVPRQMSESDRNIVNVFLNGCKNYQSLISQTDSPKSWEFSVKNRQYHIQQFEYMLENNIIFIPNSL